MPTVIRRTSPYNKIGLRFEETETKRIFKVVGAWINVFNHEVIDVVYEDAPEEEHKQIIVRTIKVDEDEILVPFDNLFGRKIVTYAEYLADHSIDTADADQLTVKANNYNESVIMVHEIDAYVKRNENGLPFRQI